MLVSIGGLKGGVGRTLVAASLARSAHEAGMRTLGVDVGARPDLSDWARLDLASNPKTIRLEPASFDCELLHDLARGFDLVVVDLPDDPRVLAAAAAVSQRVLVPCGASPAEVWSLGDTFDLLRSSAAEVQVLPCGHDPRTRLGKRLRHDLHHSGIPLCEADLPRRSAHVEAFVDGSAATQHDPASLAAAELRGLLGTFQARPTSVARLLPAVH